MNTLHLEYFMSIAQHKSINKAAQALFINRSSLMNALTSLENELGVSLFERTPSGVTLTKKGQEVYTGAIEIFNIIDSWKTTPQDNESFVNFSISAVPAIQTYIPSLISSFKLQNAHTSFNILSINNSLEQLKASLSLPNAVAFGGLYSYGLKNKTDCLYLLNHDDYATYYLFSSPFVLYCNTQNPLTKKSPIFLNDIVTYQLYSLTNMSFTNILNSVNFIQEPCYMLNVEQIFSVLEKNTNAISFLSFLHYQHGFVNNNLCTIPINDYSIWMNYFLACKKELLQTPIGKSFIDFSIHFNHC